MIANSWKLTSKIFDNHLSFWLSNGGEILKKIYIDEHGIYKYFLDNEQFEGFRYLYEKRYKILFGEERFHKDINLKLVNTIGFDINSDIKRLCDEFIKDWPIKTEKGHVSFNKRMIKVNKLKIKEIFNKIKDSAQKENNNELQYYMQYLIDNFELQPSAVVKAIEEDLSILINANESTSYTMKQLCNYIWNYDKFQSEKDEWGGTVFILTHKNRCCPFCGRQYLTSYLDRNGSVKATAQIDHFLPQKEYPYFAISLFNLSPICAWCNNKKREYDSIKQKPMLNPNTIKKKDIKFTLINTKTGSEFISAKEALSNVEDIAIKISSKRMKSELEITKQKIYLETIYQAHIIEVIELLKKIDKCTQYYIEKQINMGLFTSREEVEMFLFSDILTCKDGEVPLMKLKKNIFKNYYFIK